MNENIQRTENMHKLEIQACQEGLLLPAMKNRSQFTTGSDGPFCHILLLICDSANLILWLLLSKPNPGN